MSDKQDYGGWIPEMLAEMDKRKTEEYAAFWRAVESEIINGPLTKGRITMNEGTISYELQFGIAQEEVDGKAIFSVHEKSTGKRVALCDDRISRVVRVWKALELEAFARWLA